MKKKNPLYKEAMNLRISVFILFLASSLCGCQKKTSPITPSTQELRLSIHSEPPCLDPRKAGDTTSIAVIKMCFEGLTRMNPQGGADLAIADGVEISSDHLHARFHLKEARWSDGALVTAHDFEKTWKTILDPNYPSYISENLYVIKGAKEAKEGTLALESVGVKALDDHTLEIELKHPVPYLLELLSTSAFLPTPSHITTTYPGWAEHSGALFIGNGPFVLASWRHYNEMVLEKSPTYWDKDVVRLEKIHLLMIEDENTELAMFENGELDWAGFPLSSLPTDALEFLSNKEKLHTHPLCGTYFYLFNTQSPPFDNKHIRRAFALAIDRLAIIDNVLQGEQLPATSLIPPPMWKERISYFKDGDTQEAQRLFAIGLQEMGVSKEELPPITLIYNTMQSHHKIAQAIQQQWFEAFGVRVRLENKEWKVYLDELSKRQFQIARMGGMASFCDPVFFLDDYKYASSSKNFPKWGNPQFTEHLETASSSTELEKRIFFLKEAETLLMEEMPLIPLYFYTGSYLKKPYVHGVVVNELSDIDFKRAFVE